MNAVAARARRVLLHGILWGVLASVLEWVTLHGRATAWSEGLQLLLSIMPMWCAVGMCLAAWVEIAGARLLRPAFLVASTLGCAVVLSGVWSLLYALPWGLDRMDVLFPNGRSAVASYVYQAWVIAFYGGLYFFLWTINRRAERTHALLAEAQLARMRAETLLGESQLEALREHVDPGFLLEIVSEAERRYVSDTAGADRLIGRLVVFLRLAMPGVRTGRSSLQVELRLAKAYADLCVDAGTATAAWTMSAPPGIPDIPLPPLLIAVLLDSAATSTGAHVRLDASLEGDRVVLRVSPPAGSEWLAPDRAYRMRVGLSTLYGSDWSFDPSAGLAAPMLTLPARVPSHSQPRETIHA